VVTPAGDRARWRKLTSDKKVRHSPSIADIDIEVPGRMTVIPATRNSV